VLELKDGKELGVHSLVLRLASPELNDALSIPPAAGSEALRRLPLPHDNLKEWQCLLQLISVHLPDPDLSLVGAIKSLHEHEFEVVISI
jgi:hypothetical protein